MTRFEIDWTSPWMRRPRRQNPLLGPWLLCLIIFGLCLLGIMGHIVKQRCEAVPEAVSRLETPPPPPVPVEPATPSPAEVEAILPFVGIDEDGGILDDPEYLEHMRSLEAD